jgi:hypothetical protein
MGCNRPLQFDRFGVFLAVDLVADSRNLDLVAKQPHLMFGKFDNYMRYYFDRNLN